MRSKEPAFTWSYSASQSFNRCQRKWYFRHQVANHLSINEIRHEAFLLSQLQSLEAWCGSVVDDVIEKLIIIPLNQRKELNPDSILIGARHIFERQWEFARKRRSREPGLIKTDHKWEYAALFDLEYGNLITEHALEKVWNDAEIAITRLLSSEEIMRLLTKSNYRVAQRRLTFSINEITITAVPDVILFFENDTPTIIDWKVKRHTENGFWLQLACYALALTRCKPHKDFKKEVVGLEPYQIQLKEIQLLGDEIYNYNFKPEDVDSVETEIYTAGREIYSAVKNDDNDLLWPYDYDPTCYPDECTECPFQKMCWLGESEWRNLLQTYSE